MPDFTITVPGPAPALNATYKAAGAGANRRIYKDSKVSTWQDTCAWLVKAARPRDWRPGEKIMITIEWYMPRKRDCDAGIKSVLDAVAVGLGVDDSIFLVCVPINDVDKVSPRSVIHVENVW